MKSKQLSLPGLHSDIMRSYKSAGDKGLDNELLYAALPIGAQRAPVGRVGKQHDLGKRKVLWHQQTLKKLGLLEPIPGERGRWRCTPRGKQLDAAPEGQILVSYSTKLGVALWARCNSVFSSLGEPIALCLTSS